MRKNTEAQVSGGIADGSVEGSAMGLERSSDVVLAASVGQPGNGKEPAGAVKPFERAKRVVLEAYRHVKANQGSTGIDGKSIEMFEVNLKDNRYRLWDRLSSGSYMPPVIRLVEKPKKTGSVRTLGIATIEDRIAQTVAKGLHRTGSGAIVSSEVLRVSSEQVRSAGGWGEPREMLEIRLGHRVRHP